MTRKLFALLLSVLAVILLMGAGVDNAADQPTELTSSARTEEPAEPVYEPIDPIEKTPDADAPEQETDTDPEEPVEVPEEPQLPEEPEEQEGPEEPEEPEEPEDRSFLLDGQPLPLEVCRISVRDTMYVSFEEMVQLLDPTAQVAWDEEGRRATVTTEQLQLELDTALSYLVANGRYLYMPYGLQYSEEQVLVPLKALAKAFDAQVSWDNSTKTVLVTRGSGAILSGDQFYNEDDLFWMSRVIYAEAGNQCLEGRIAVGNVVLNRVASSVFPDTILGVLSQKNQFSTYRNGKLADRTPNTGSVIAAKLVLDGAVVEEVANALYFDCATNSWASRHRNCIAVIEDHKFYD